MTLKQFKETISSEYALGIIEEIQDYYDIEDDVDFYFDLDQGCYVDNGEWFSLKKIFELIERVQ